MPTAEQKRHKEADAAYRAIGRYTVKFSQLVLHVRNLVARGIVPSETNDNDEYVELILAPAGAAVITEAFFNVYSRIGKHTAGEAKVGTKLKREVRDVIEYRNALAHGDLWVGWGDEPVRVRVSGTEVGGEGIDPKTLEKQTDDLITLTETVIEFGTLSLGLGVIAFVPNTQLKSVGRYRVSDVLVLEGNKKQRTKVVRSGPHAKMVLPLTLERYQLSSPQDAKRSLSRSESSTPASARCLSPLSASAPLGLSGTALPLNGSGPPGGSGPDRAHRRITFVRCDLARRSS